MKKCIIIGGGPAGLTAGYELLKKSNEYEVYAISDDGSIVIKKIDNGNYESFVTITLNKSK